MPQRITPDQIQVGDEIRIDRVIEGTVTRGRNGLTSDYIQIDGMNRRVTDGQGMVNTITLLNRPLELPTTPGSIVELSTGDLSASARWFLGGSIWVSSLGVEKSPGAFREFITARNYTIKEM